MTNRRSATILHLALAPALFAGVAVVGMTHTSPEAGWVGMDHAIGRDTNIAPKVDLPKGCTTKAFLTDDVLAVPNDYYAPAPIHLTFSQALHDAKAGKVWIVGYCK
jgi:hypothetical protein